MILVKFLGLRFRMQLCCNSSLSSIQSSICNVRLWIFEFHHPSLLMMPKQFEFQSFVINKIVEAKSEGTLKLHDYFMSFSDMMTFIGAYLQETLPHARLETFGQRVYQKYLQTFCQFSVLMILNFSGIQACANQPTVHSQTGRVCGSDCQLQ